MHRTALTLATTLLAAVLLAASGTSVAAGRTVKPEAYAAFATGLHEMETGRPDQAAAWLEKAVELDPDSAEPHSWLGLLYDEQLHQPSKAKEQFDLALKLAPDSFRARYGIARQLLQAGQDDKAREQLQLAVKSPEAQDDPSLVARAYSEFALHAESRREWERAAEYYTKAAESSPNPAYLLLRVARLYQGVGQNDKAIDALRGVAKYIPGYARVHRELATLYAGSGRWQQALEELSAYTAHPGGPGEQAHLLKEQAALAQKAGRPDLARTIREKLLARLTRQYEAENSSARAEEIADTLEDLGRVGQIEPYLKKAIETADKDSQPVLRMKLAGIYEKLRQFDKAVAELNECIRTVEPKASIRYRTELCAVLESAEKYAEAEAALRTILDIPGSKAAGCAELGLFFGRRGETDKAVKNLLEAITLADTDKSIRYRIHLSILYGEAHRDKDAEKTLVEAHRAFPDNASVSNALGWFYAERGVQLDKALDLVLAAIKTNPDNPYFLDSLGWVYFKQGRKKEALEQLLKAAALAEDSAICDHLGDVYKELGNAEKAGAEWKRSLELNPKTKGVREKLEQLNK